MQNIGKTFSRFYYVIIYLLLTFFFAVHLYYVIIEHLSKKFVDITYYERLEKFAPDVALCAIRPYIAHKMDLMASYHGCFRPQSNLRCMTNRDFWNSERRSSRFFEVHVPEQGMLDKEESVMKKFDDIIIRCQSRGYKCGVEDFVVFPRYIRHNRICLIFKAKAFFKKIRRSKKKGFALESRPDSKDSFLSIFMRTDWLKEEKMETYKPMSHLYCVSTKPEVYVYLIKSDSAMLTTSKKITSSNLIPYESIGPENWRDLTFSLAVTNRSVDECSSEEYFELIDEINGTIHRFPYSEDLCRVITKQIAIKKRCGCYDKKLPLNRSMKNVTYCQTVPEIFRQAKNLSADCTKLSLSLFNAENVKINVQPFDAEVFINIHCAKRKIFTNTTCPSSCKGELSGKILESSSSRLDFESVEEEFYNNTEVMNISELLSRKYAVVRMEPQSWSIPITKKEEIYPMSKLLSDMGGMLGMWLGASVLGFIKFLITIRRGYALSKSSKSESFSFNNSKQ